ncbi:MAG TPA: nitroreductase family protein [Thermoanaerobaculia bacterium]|nr:nitroreductase family protein [Thermoanaerobaculia bacterium]HUM29205.1 nitroreductase family protein [Thermoanaerobaculia bacterium]HXK67836.1 nitroreductase family protein [Thermoanaerobaculia bacterium]
MANVKTGFCAVLMFLFSLTVWGETTELKDIQLPAPQMEGGKPLMQVLKERHSTRNFSPEKLPLQVMSNLLWAAFGVNRPDTGKRTAPSARNWQEVEIFVFLEEGVYQYEAKPNILKYIKAGDIRKLAGVQDFVATAPMNLVYVADRSKMAGSKPEDQDLYSAADTGFICQNVYLYCASEGLRAVVRGSIDREALAKALNLSEDYRVILSQTVGYPQVESSKPNEHK